MSEPLKIKIPFILEELQWVWDEIRTAKAGGHYTEKFKEPISARLEKAIALLEEETTKRERVKDN